MKANKNYQKMCNKRNPNEQLAIFGGPKTRSSPMPFRRAFGPEEIKMVKKAMQYYASQDQDPPYQGYFQKLLCSEFSDYMGGGFSNAVATGTGAVFVALEALEPTPGSEILISPFVDAGPFNCILYKNCRPILCDSGPLSYNVNLDSVLSKVTGNTSVAIIVHSAGAPVEIEKIVKELQSRGIKVLEDCSQAPGASIGDKKVGAFGDIAAFSTMYRKTLTTGASGGIVYTQNVDLHRKALAYADRGKPTWNENYDFRSPSMHLFPALNWNTDELSCAIGLASLRRLNKSLRKRMSFCLKLKKSLKKLSKVCRIYDLPENSSPFFLPVWVDTSQLSIGKAEFASAIKKEGIDLNEHYDFLVSDWPWAKEQVDYVFKTPSASYTKANSFNLFVNENYGKKEVDDIINAILKVEKYFLSAAPNVSK